MLGCRRMAVRVALDYVLGERGGEEREVEIGACGETYECDVDRSLWWNIIGVEGGICMDIVIIVI